MNVTNFKTGSLTGQTTRSESGEATLVRDLRKGIGLVHKLGKLTRTEELLNNSRNRLGVNQVVRHQAVNFLQAHALLNGALHTNETNTVLIFKQFTNSTYAAIAKMVNVVNLDRQFTRIAIVVLNFPFMRAITQIDQVTHDFKDILFGQSRYFERQLQPKLMIQLESTDCRKIVAFFVEEET